MPTSELKGDLLTAIPAIVAQDVMTMLIIATSIAFVFAVVLVVSVVARS